jgi:hypothetical protein
MFFIAFPREKTRKKFAVDGEEIHEEGIYRISFSLDFAASRPLIAQGR